MPRASRHNAAAARPQWVNVLLSVAMVLLGLVLGMGLRNSLHASINSSSSHEVVLSAETRGRIEAARWKSTGPKIDKDLEAGDLMDTGPVAADPEPAAAAAESSGHEGGAEDDAAPLPMPALEGLGGGPAPKDGSAPMPTGDLGAEHEAAALKRVLNYKNSSTSKPAAQLAEEMGAYGRALPKVASPVTAQQGGCEEEQLGFASSGRPEQSIVQDRVHVCKGHSNIYCWMDGDANGNISGAAFCEMTDVYVTNIPGEPAVSVYCTWETEEIQGKAPRSLVLSGGGGLVELLKDDTVKIFQGDDPPAADEGKPVQPLGGLTYLAVGACDQPFNAFHCLADPVALVTVQHHLGVAPADTHVKLMAGFSGVDTSPESQSPTMQLYQALARHGAIDVDAAGALWEEAWIGAQWFDQAAPEGTLPPEERPVLKLESVVASPDVERSLIWKDFWKDRECDGVSAPMVALRSSVMGVVDGAASQDWLAEVAMQDDSYVSVPSIAPEAIAGLITVVSRRERGLNRDGVQPKGPARILNMGALVYAVQEDFPNHIVVVTPMSSLPLPLQYELWHRSNAVLAAHGGALSNAWMMSGPRQTLMEVWQGSKPRPYKHMAAMLGVKHALVECQGACVREDGGEISVEGALQALHEFVA